MKVNRAPTAPALYAVAVSSGRRKSMKPENRRCQVDPTHPGPISKRKLCVACAVERATAGAIAMKSRQGPAWESWKESMRRLADRY